MARELVLGSGLPTPLWNPTLLDAGGNVIACPDAWFDDVGPAWEIDSKDWPRRSPPIPPATNGTFVHSFWTEVPLVAGREVEPRRS
jgi:hypothetical protein